MVHEHAVVEAVGDDDLDVVIDSVLVWVTFWCWAGGDRRQRATRQLRAALVNNQTRASDEKIDRALNVGNKTASYLSLRGGKNGRHGVSLGDPE